MASALGIGPDAERTGLVLKFRWRKSTYTLFLGFAVRRNRTTLVLAPPYPPAEVAPQAQFQTMALRTRGAEGEPLPPPPEPPNQPTGVTPPADGRGSGPPTSQTATEENTYRLEIGVSRTTDTTEGVTPPADGSDKKKPP